jgi:hypothetical protein
MKRYRKHSFVLIEVVTALSLLSISAFLFLSHPAKVYKKELSLLQQRELERTFENVFFDLTQDLGNFLSFEEIHKEGTILSLGRYTLNLGLLGTFPYAAKCLITEQKPNSENAQISHKLLSIEIALTPLNKPCLKPAPVTYLYHVKKETFANK